MSDDDFLDRTNPGDVSIATANSKQMMTESHIMEQHTHKYQGPVPLELLNVAPNEPQSYNSPYNYQLDFVKQIQGFKHYIENKQCNIYNGYRSL